MDIKKEMGRKKKNDLAEVTGYFQNIPKHSLLQLEYTDEELQGTDEEKARRL